MKARANSYRVDGIRRAHCDACSFSLHQTPGSSRSFEEIGAQTAAAALTISRSNCARGMPGARTRNARCAARSPTWLRSRTEATPEAREPRGPPTPAAAIHFTLGISCWMQLRPSRCSSAPVDVMRIIEAAVHTRREVRRCA